MITFTIIPTAAGFTDQLRQFNALYKLGLSLGYKYFHTPFLSSRSSRCIRLSIFEKIAGKLENKFPFLRKYYSFMRRRSNFDVYDFLGFNQYFNSVNICLETKSLKVIDIELNDDILKLNHVNSFEGLQKFIQNRIENKFNLASNNILVEFRSTGGKRHKICAFIHSNIPNFQDSLSLRSIYFERRKESPCESRFLNNKIKILLHIRQGDTSVIETPWKTYIPVRRLEKMKEYKKLENIEQTVFLPTDYLNFMKNFISRLDDRMFSILTFSDGFQRAFMLLERHIEKFEFNSTQIQSLRKIRKLYDKIYFKKIRKLKNSKCFVGESSRNLSNLIHSTLNSDIVITSSQQRMLPKLVECYCDAIKPIVVILYKGSKPEYDDISFMHEERFIYTDLYRPNYEYIFQRLMSLVHE